jgi:transcriptional regulator with XRE-family HTH domain
MFMPERSEIGKRIASACALRGMSMGQLAKEIGIARNTLSRIVTGDIGDPGSNIVRDIAQTLRVSTDFLLGLSDEMDSHHEPAALATVGD